MIYQILAKKGQVDHKLPLWKVEVYDLPGPFLGLFFLGGGGVFLGPKKGFVIVVVFVLLLL